MVNEDGVVEGTAYLQGTAEIYPRMRRAPSARLTLHLVPVDEPDATPAKSGTQNLGVVVPIPVRLKFRPSDLDLTRDWGVIATLETGGVVSHRTQAPFPAIVDGRLKNLALVLTPSRDN